MSRAKSLEAITTIKNCRILALLLTIFPTHSYIVIGRKASLEINDLVHQGLLDTEDIGILVGKQIRYHGQSLHPAITSLHIIGIIVANIIGSDKELLSL